jgi:hypothetical protein
MLARRDAAGVRLLTRNGIDCQKGPVKSQKGQGLNGAGKGLGGGSGVITPPGLGAFPDRSSAWQSIAAKGEETKRLIYQSQARLTAAERRRLGRAPNIVVHLPYGPATFNTSQPDAGASSSRCLS